MATATATQSEVARDSNWHDCSDSDFHANGMCFAFRNGSDVQFRRVYEVSESAWKWDLGNDFEVPEDCQLMALGSRQGYMCYVFVKRTGRKVTRAPHDYYGLKHQVTFGLSTMKDYPCDVETVSGWMLAGHWEGDSSHYGRQQDAFEV